MHCLADLATGNVAHCLADLWALWPVAVSALAGGGWCWVRALVRR